MIDESMVAKVNLLDHGYIKYIEHWGADERVIEAARMSTGKGFLGWEPGMCPICVGTGEIRTNSETGEIHGTLSYKDEIVPCTGCEGKGKIAGDKNLLRRLWVKKHATPFEMAGLIVEVQAPIMVYREWHRHRTQSYNEMSARYVPLPNLNYIPSVERLMIGSDSKNKQAGTIKDAEALTERNAVEFQLALKDNYKCDQMLYETALKMGVPKELARVHLPVGRYSRMRASANLRNWLGFLILRMSEDAQWEIRQYANEVHRFLKTLFPRTVQLFDEGREQV